MKFIHQHNGNGRHRIIHPNGQVGESSCYQHPAFLKVEDKLFMAVTSYYGDGGRTIREECVYEVTPTAHTMGVTTRSEELPGFEPKEPI